MRGAGTEATTTKHNIHSGGEGHAESTQRHAQQHKHPHEHQQHGTTWARDEHQPPHQTRGAQTQHTRQQPATHSKKQKQKHVPRGCEKVARPGWSRVEASRVWRAWKRTAQKCPLCMHPWWCSALCWGLPWTWRRMRTPHWHQDAHHWKETNKNSNNKMQQQEATTTTTTQKKVHTEHTHAPRVNYHQLPCSPSHAGRVSLRPAQQRTY